MMRSGRYRLPSMLAYIAAAEQTERENEHLRSERDREYNRSEALLGANSALTRERDELKAKLEQALDRAKYERRVSDHASASET